MFQVENVEQWKGQDVVDTEGDRIGKVEEILFDSRSGQPTLAVVKAGLISKSHVLVPLAGASLARDHVRLAYPKELVESAPQLDSSAGVTRDDELMLARHYSVTAPDHDDAAEGPLYRSSHEIAEQQAAAEAATNRAAELEAEADRKQAVVVEGQTTAAQAVDRADSADEERRALLEEAEQLRRQAEDG